MDIPLIFAHLPSLMSLTSHTPDTGLAAYQVVMALPLPVERLAWLVVALHRAARRPPLPGDLALALAEQGPVLSWAALPDLGPKRVAHLRAVFSAADLHDNLAAQLQAMAALPSLPAREAAVGQWPRLPPPLPRHPLGEGARFPPRVAQALGVEAATVLGEPIALPGFAFSSMIIHFRDAIQRPTPAAAVVIGGGYIGAEVAVGWAMDGAEVTLIERGSQLMPRFFDADVAAVSALLADSGVRLCTGTEATGWTRHERRIAVACRRGEQALTLEADLVLVAVGVHPPG